MNKKQVKEIDIEDVVTVCPYCMTEMSSGALGHCGESSTHFEDAYIIEDECYLKREIEVIK
jgi:hypothetical protein